MVSPIFNRRRCIALLVVLIVALSACSSSKSKGSGGSGGTDAIPVLQYGVYHSTIQSAPELADGAQAAAAAINASGGVGGRQIKVITCDASNDTNKSVKCVRDGISSKVVATVGVQDYAGAATLPLLTASHVASVGINPLGSADYNSPSSFPLNGSALTPSVASCAILAEKGAKSIAVLSQDSAAGAPTRNACVDNLKKRGITPKVILVPIGAPDMLPYISQATSADGIAIILNLNDTLRVMQGLVQAGYKKPVAENGSAWPTGADFQKVCAGLNGSYAAWKVYPWASADASGPYAQFLADMKKYKPNAPINDYSWGSYSSVFVVAQVAKNLTKIDAQSMWDALSKANDIKLPDGSTVDFTKPNPHNITNAPRLFKDTATLTQVDGCKFTVVQKDFSPFQV